MAKEAVALLFRDAQQNPVLREELNQAENVEAFVAQAKARGYDFTVEEWQAMTQFAVEEIKGELSEIPGL